MSFRRLKNFSDTSFVGVVLHHMLNKLRHKHASVLLRVQLRLDIITHWREAKQRFNSIFNILLQLLTVFIKVSLESQLLVRLIFQHRKIKPKIEFIKFLSFKTLSSLQNRLSTIIFNLL